MSITNCQAKRLLRNQIAIGTPNRVRDTGQRINPFRGNTATRLVIPCRCRLSGSRAGNRTPRINNWGYRRIHVPGGCRGHIGRSGSSGILRAVPFPSHIAQKKYGDASPDIQIPILHIPAPPIGIYMGVGEAWESLLNTSGVTARNTPGTGS